MNLPVFPFRAVFLWENFRKCLASRKRAVFYPFRAVFLGKYFRKCLASRMNAVLYPFREGYCGKTWRKSFSKRTTRDYSGFAHEIIKESPLRTTLEVYKPVIHTAMPGICSLPVQIPLFYTPFYGSPAGWSFPHGAEGGATARQGTAAAFHPGRAAVNVEQPGLFLPGCGPSDGILESISKKHEVAMEGSVTGYYVS